MQGPEPPAQPRKPDWTLSDLFMGCPLLRGVGHQTSNRERDTHLTSRLKEQNALTKETRKKKEQLAAANAQTATGGTGGKKP